MAGRSSRPGNRVFVPPPVVTEAESVGVSDGPAASASGKPKWIPPPPTGRQPVASRPAVESAPTGRQPVASRPAVEPPPNVARPSSGSVLRPSLGRSPRRSGIRTAPPGVPRVVAPLTPQKLDVLETPETGSVLASAEAPSEPPMEASSAQERVSVLGLQNELARLDSLLADVLEDE